MLLFGMMNWMFTWLRPNGALTHADMTPVVADLFFGGLAAVKVPARAATPRRAPASTTPPARPRGTRRSAAEAA
jgi:TetR/AcrR family transcriptional regulator